MANCKLIIDSCCDLPPEVIQRQDICLLKFPYVIDGETFEDDLFQSVSAKEFYDGMRNGAEPSTCQLTIPVLTELFTSLAKEGTPAVYLSFTSGLSGSFAVAELVRDQILEQFPDYELHLVDTYLASVAEGLLIYEAILQHEKGMTASELASWASEACHYVDEEFMVDDLGSLRRGGRIPGSVALAGGALDVKPLLNIDAQGKLALIGVARGRKKGIRQLVEYYEKNASHQGMSECVVIGHADCPKDVERLKDQLLKVDKNILFLESNIGPVIGSHVGPGMIAVVFWGFDKREKLSVSDRIARKVRGGD